MIGYRPSLLHQPAVDLLARHPAFGQQPVMNITLIPLACHDPAPHTVS